MTTYVQKWGNSHGIRIPKHLLESVNWCDNEEVIISAENGKLIIEKAQKRKNIIELFADYDGEYKPEEIDWGKPVGREIW